MSTFRIIALKVLDDSPKYQSKVLMPCTTYFFFRGYEDVPGTNNYPVSLCVKESYAQVTKLINN